MKEIITASGAPAAIGPYSHAVRSGLLLFTSGQIALVPESGKLVSDDFEQQSRQVMENLRAVLQSAGLSFHNVIKSTIFITDLANFPIINKIYGESFESEPPARSCVQVAALPAGAKVEIEMIASFD